MMLALTIAMSAYPIYFWSKAAAMIGGLTGPYLAYLHLRSAPQPKLTPLRTAIGVGFALLYQVIIVFGNDAAKKFMKSASQILLSNIVIFLSVTFVALGLCFLMN